MNRQTEMDGPQGLAPARKKFDPSTYNYTICTRITFFSSMQEQAPSGWKDRKQTAGDQTFSFSSGELKKRITKNISKNNSMKFLKFNIQWDIQC